MSRQQALRLFRHKGFTLIEILLVMLIVSIIVLGMNAAYHQAHALRTAIEIRRPIYHDARLITETLRQELSCLYFPLRQDQEITPFKLLSLPDGAVELQFHTLAPAWKGTLETSRIARVRYVFSRNQDNDNATLQRFEQAWSGEKAIGQENSAVIAKGLSEFRLWVYDPNAPLSASDSWGNSYDSKDAPPRALRVRIKWQGSEKMPEINFTYSIWIPSDAAIS